MPRSISSSSTRSRPSPPSPRRSWQRIPTSPIASLACAIWAVSAVAAAAFDLQAHRGGRGLAPENTLAAFRQAAALGVTTLETDLAITKDDVVVLSHEPRLNPDLVRGPDGNWIDGVGPTIRSLTLAELKRYDIGRINPASHYAPAVPEQMPVDGERFPTLAEVFAVARRRCGFNIETKTDPTRPDDTVDPGPFTRLVVDAVKAGKAVDRTMIQSFDWRTLIEVRKARARDRDRLPDHRDRNNDTIRRQSHALALAGRARSQGSWRLGAAAGQGRGLRRLVAVLAQPDARDRWPRPMARPEGHSLDGQRSGRHGPADRPQS